MRQSRGRGFERVVKGIEHCNAKRLMKEVGLVMRSTFDIYSPMQDVAPRAVRIALAIDTMICAINFAVSFLLITLLILI